MELLEKLELLGPATRFEPAEEVGARQSPAREKTTAPAPFTTR
jgi:hypothetical protein